MKRNNLPLPPKRMPAGVAAITLGLLLSIFTGSLVHAEKAGPSTMLARCSKLLTQGRPASTTRPNSSDAAIALGLLGDENAASALIAQLQREKNNDLRTKIVRSLGWLRFQSALPALEAAASDPYRHVPIQAALAIRKINGEIPAHGYARSPVFAPGNSGADAVLERCAKILAYGPVNDIDKPSKADAAITLGLMGDESVVPLLADHLENEENQHLRLQIVRALGWIKSRTTVLALENALNDPYVLVRKHASTALQETTGKKYDYDRTGEEQDHPLRREERRFLIQDSMLELDR